MFTEVGQFAVISSALFVSDPCYNYDTWCAKKICDVKNGNWKAYVLSYDFGKYGIRNISLLAIHENYNESDLANMRMEIIDTLGVDSGQLGIFDYDNFKNDKQFSEDYEPNFNISSTEQGYKFYGACCDATFSGVEAGVLPYGCVTSSGFGDGIYEAYIYYENDEVVAVEAIFELI